jgi:hypothetical protein
VENKDRERYNDRWKEKGKKGERETDRETETIMVCLVGHFGPE